MLTTIPLLSETLALVIPQGMFWTKRWHLISGCTPVSEGCTNCWMRREAKLRAGNPHESIRRLHEGLLTETGQWNSTVRFNEHLLDLPLRSRKPQVFAIWSDLFHESVSDSDIDKTMAVILACAVLYNRPHQFIAPTKRADRQQRYFSSRTPAEHLQAWAKAGSDFIFIDDGHVTFEEYVMGHCYGPSDETGRILEDRGDWGYTGHLFPLPNLIGCVTTENQTAADIRIPSFLATPFNRRVLLAEPLLGPVEIRHGAHGFVLPHGDMPAGPHGRIHGVMTGGESGPSARPSYPDWFRSLRDQCEEAGTTFFFKGWGEWAAWDGCSPDAKDNPEQTKFLTMEWEDDKWNDVGYPLWCDSVDGNICPENCTSKVGKKRSGRQLDGKEHNKLPENNHD